jgi:transposase, IS30 family
MTYDQITQEERYQIAALRALGYWGAAIARRLRRHRSTILRELRRNRTARGPYVAYAANGKAEARRRHSRRNQRVRPQDWARVCRLLAAVESRANRRALGPRGGHADQSGDDLPAAAL